MTMPRVLRSLGKDRESGWRFTLLLCIPYLAFMIWMHAHHEMWRDEIHPWTLARLAHGFSELATGDSIYEGHPPLWFWYLHVWTWFVQGAWGIQAATIAASVAAAALLVRFAPFPRYLKVLLLFSYYFGYEYTVMSRNYVLGWLLACGFCALYHTIRVRYLAAALALGLLCLTSFYGLVMSIFLLGFFILDRMRISLSSRTTSPPSALTLTLSISPRAFVTFALVSAAILFCVLTVDPPDPNPFSPGFIWSDLAPKALPRMLFRLTTGILPWSPKWASDFWWASQLPWESRVLLSTCVGAGLLIWALVALYPSWRLMLTYAGAVATMELFQQVRHEGCARHWGHYFMFFVVCSWLLRTTFAKRSHLISTLLLLGVLGLQAPTFLAATVVDSREVFSGGRETAAFIRREHLQDLPIVAGPDYAAVTVAGFLGRPFFAAETEEVNQTVVYHNRHRKFSEEELMTRAMGVSRANRSPVLLICTRPLPDPPAGVTRTWLFTSRPGTVADETFSVYRLQAD